MLKKDINQLEKTAIKWWPTEIQELAQEISIIPKLLATHDRFISLLKLFNPHSPHTLFALIDAAEFPANVFVKHLSILTDFGGELLKRLSNTYEDIFFRNENDELYFKYILDGKEEYYCFKSQNFKGLSNKKLKIDGEHFAKEYYLNDLYEDVIMILMYGAFSGHDLFLECDIAARVSDSESLDTYLKQRYISVSKITSGAKSNSNGQILQKLIQTQLQQNLGENFFVKSNGKVELENQEEDYLNFDIVVTKKNVNSCIGFEISFQVTTNSVIERKAVSAQRRLNMMHSEGHYVGYIIDGAGNFERRSAVGIICNYSDCTVNCSQSDLLQLSSWIRNTLV
jgi:hypothetical protein